MNTRKLSLLALTAFIPLNVAMADKTELGGILNSEVRGGSVSAVLLTIASINWENERASLDATPPSEEFLKLRNQTPNRCDALDEAMRYDFAASDSRADQLLLKKAAQQFTSARKNGLNIDEALVPVYAGMLSWSFIWNQPPLCACSMSSSAADKVGQYCSSLQLKADGLWPFTER